MNITFIFLAGGNNENQRVCRRRAYYDSETVAHTCHRAKPNEENAESPMNLYRGGSLPLFLQRMDPERTNRVVLGGG